MKIGFNSGESYLEILGKELEQRKLKNRAYSLRSFARDIGVSPSRLSEVLNGNGKLSIVSAATIADKCGLADDARDYFVSLVELEHSASLEHKAVIQDRIDRHIISNGFKQLDIDAFHVIADWFHFAILELCVLQNFKSDRAWIAQKLNLPLAVADRAIDRLLKFRYLEEKDQILKTVEANSTVNHDIPSQAVRNFHKQLLKKAIYAIDSQPIDLREFDTLLTTIPVSALPLAKKLIREFSRNFSKEMKSTQPKEAVYCLSTKFFRIDKDLVLQDATPDITEPVLP